MKKPILNDLRQRDTNYSKRVLKALIIAGLISSLLWAIAWAVKVVNEPQGQDKYDSNRILNRR